MAHNYRACVSFVIIVSMQLILILDSVVVVVFNINSAWQLQPQGGCEHCMYSASHFYLISTNTSQLVEGVNIALNSCTGTGTNKRLVQMQNQPHGGCEQVAFDRKICSVFNVL